MLSCVVLTKNEEKNTKGCLKGLKFCDEIIVVDDYSEDGTVEIAKSEKLKAKNYNLKLKIYRRRLDNDFAAQRNFALQKAGGDWVLFIDGDETISSGLAEEIVSSTSFQQPATSGFYFKRKDKFLGRWLKHGETANVKLLRLAKKNSGSWQGKVHETWQVKGKIKTLQNPLIHERSLTIGEFLARINFYSSVRAEELWQKGDKTNIFMIFVYPIGKFFYNYLLRLGFFDGIEGFIFATMMSLHSFLVRGKLWIMWQNEGKEEFKVSL